MNFFSLALLSTGAFLSTNIDDLFLLVGFFSDRSFSRGHIFARPDPRNGDHRRHQPGRRIGGPGDLPPACRLARPRAHCHRNGKAIAPREDRGGSAANCGRNSSGRDRYDRERGRQHRRVYADLRDPRVSGHDRDARDLRRAHACLVLCRLRARQAYGVGQAAAPLRARSPALHSDRTWRPHSVPIRRHQPRDGVGARGRSNSFASPRPVGRRR